MMSSNRFRHAIIVLCLVILTGCADSLFYHPNRKIYRNPAEFGLAYEDVFFKSKDGTKLHGWFFPSKDPAWGTVVHYHGNAANISGHVNLVSFIPARGCNLLMFDYRGYGESDGTPERKGVYEDSVAALDYVRSRPGIDRERIFLIGQSLGGANAIAVAATFHDSGIKAVVIDSSFYSYRSIVKDKIGRIPVVGWFKSPLSYVMATDSFPSCDLIVSISPVPILIIHGTDDNVIPYHHGMDLFARAAQPKTMLTIPGGNHITAFIGYHGFYQDKVIEFLKASVNKE